MLLITIAWRWWIVIASSAIYQVGVRYAEKTVGPIPRRLIWTDEVRTVERYSRLSCEYLGGGGGSRTRVLRCRSRTSPSASGDL